MEKNVEQCRKDKKNWRVAKYSKAKSKEFGKYDSHEKTRYALLLELQYDVKAGDEALIRYLLKQEIKARENDSFQGIGDALWLGCYLLASFERAEDIPLFYRAKFANFDTGCGFDREFMFWALKEKTEDYVLKHHPDLYDEVKGGFIGLNLEERLDDWWQCLVKMHPNNEADEDVWTLYDRSVYFDRLDEAKGYLEQWQQSEPESSDKDSRLRYAYAELGDFALAIEYAKKELPSKKSHWDKASCHKSILELYNKMGSPKQGLKTIKKIDKQFSQFDDWHDVGLGRMAVHEAFEYALATKDKDTARAAFNIAHSWFKKMDSIAFVGLEAGWKAAQKCGFIGKAEKYKKRAAKERKRIDKM